MMVENISDDTEQLYTAEYFEKSEGTKNGYTDYLSAPVANMIGKYALTRLFAKNPGKHLDLGCADGSLIEIFASEGFESRGLEISKDAVKIAQDKGLDVSYSRLDGFPKGLSKSNVVTAFDLLEHADKPRVVLQETFDNLEKDGYFVFSTLSVKKNDPSDYWYNNSLEHYIYYNRENLTYALTDIFGVGNFCFVEIEIHGIAEFWGFAKKGKITWEKEIIERIRTGDFDKNDPVAGYFVSLFYNQLSKFQESEKIIAHFEPVWTAAISIQAKFYLRFLQGKFELAVADSKVYRHLLSTRNSTYWQALVHAQDELFRIREHDIVQQANTEILELRTQVFSLKDQLYRIKKAPVVGELIRARAFAGHIVRETKRNARHFARESREILRRHLPAPIRRRLKQALVHDYGLSLAKVKQVANRTWDKSMPLVSVVIPYYDRADTIDDTLGSLYAQTFKNFETIIVDDGSTDTKSVQRLVDLEQNGLAVRLIRQSNQGVAVARNNGIKQAKGKYVICLDSDDMLDPTYIEKCTVMLEATPDVALVTTHQDMFGVTSEVFTKRPYDALELYGVDNMVITAAEFRKEAWRVSGGYKPDIGYEDWEFWINLGENGFWGKLLPEPLFKYRTSMQSRYTEDKAAMHWNNLKVIRSLHPKYKLRVKNLLLKRQYTKHVVEQKSALLNLDRPVDYLVENNGHPKVLITIPWMTFGGAETLIYNYCREIKDRFDISFITGLKSEHEWEYKFKEITPRIYHLTNLFDDPALYLEFVSNYIKTRQINILHIIHNGFTFDMLPELKKRHPHLKVIVTLFNDRVGYFQQAVEAQHYIDAFSADNSAVADHFKLDLQPDKNISVIPNGIDCFDEYNPHLFERVTERASLGLEPKDLAVFFVGRLSEEKNPDVFLRVAKTITNQSKNIKFFVIGDGPMRGDVEKLLKDVDSKSITYLGYQSEVAKYLCAADIFVLPSSIEGFPLSILEAMAMGVAVVASSVGAVPDVLNSGEDGFVVTAGSEFEISEAITKLRQDPAMLASFKTKARQKAEKKYSTTALGENYSKLYGQFTKRGK